MRTDGPGRKCFRNVEASLSPVMSRWPFQAQTEASTGSPLQYGHGHLQESFWGGHLMAHLTHDNSKTCLTTPFYPHMSTCCPSVFVRPLREIIFPQPVAGTFVLAEEAVLTTPQIAPPLLAKWDYWSSLCSMSRSRQTHTFWLCSSTVSLL